MGNHGGGLGQKEMAQSKNVGKPDARKNGEAEWDEVKFDLIKKTFMGATIGKLRWLSGMKICTGRQPDVCREG
jgi:hypothetical protein